MKTGNVRIYQLALRTFTPEGTLCAATKMLPHVAACGFTHVQLTPVNEMDNDLDQSHWSNRQVASNTGNPNNNYRLKDYYRIDPEYGTEEDLSIFIKTAHLLNLKVLLDIVYLHCSRISTLATEYPDYLQHDENGEILIGEWNMPLLDYSNADLCEYLWANMLHFVKQYDIDGYRCDVGSRVPLFFWQEGIRRCKEIKPDLFMLNEGENLEGLKVFDCNYFWSCCFDSLKIPTGEITAKAYQESWQEWREYLPQDGRILHFLENHDVCSDLFDNRPEKTLGHRAMEVLHALIFTLDGIPFVFNGNELADSLKHNMFSNRFHGRDDTLPWGNALCETGQRRIRIIKELNGLRDRYDALNTTALEWLEHDQPDAVLGYIRPASSENVLVLLNLRNEPLKVQLKFQNPFLRPILESGIAYERTEAGTQVQMLGYGYLVAIF